MTDAIENRIDEQRRTLANTLDEIEDKLNVSKQFDRYAGKAKASYEENPTPWIVGATAVAITVVGLVAWALFSGDD